MGIELGTRVECSALGDGTMRALCEWTRATGKRRVSGSDLAVVVLLASREMF